MMVCIKCTGNIMMVCPSLQGIRQPTLLWEWCWILSWRRVKIYGWINSERECQAEAEAQNRDSMSITEAWGWNRQMRLRLWKILPCERLLPKSLFFVPWYPNPGILTIPSYSLVFAFFITLTTLSAYFSWPWLISLVFVFDLPEVFVYSVPFLLGASESGLDILKSSRK